jgi:hypothetical protein
MSKFTDFVAEARASSKGTNFSKSELVSLAATMLNDDEDAITTYVKKGDTVEEKVVNPGRSLRNGVIAPVLKDFGVDKAELTKLDGVQISRGGAEAVADVALLLVKEYISTKGLGRKLTLPMLSPNETVQSISCLKAEEEKRATTMIARGEDGSYSTTPTGKVVTTKAHEKLKVVNKVPAWLKETTDAKA